MGESVDNMLKVASSAIEKAHLSPAMVAVRDLDVLTSLLPKFLDKDNAMLKELEEQKELTLLNAESLNRIAENIERLSVLPTQLMNLETLLERLNNTMGRMLHLQEFGTVRILETTNKAISGGRKTDLFRGYNESGRVQSVLLDFSHENVEGYLALDAGRIEYNYANMKQMSAFEPSGREFWISRHDDTNNRYVIQFTPSYPVPFDKRCYIRIWNRSTTDLTLNVGRLVKQTKPVDIADIKSKQYGRDIAIEQSKKLREEIALKKGKMF